MKSAQEVSEAKLRGGFYTPDDLVDLCLERIAELAAPGKLEAVEPSIGDGAFVRGLARSPLHRRIARLDGVEVMELEAEKARRAMRVAGIEGHVERRSAVAWAGQTDVGYDVAIGNPPFLRYQFIGDCDRAATKALGERLRLPFAGVGNLWIPVLLGTLSRLRPGGVFAFVVPSECFTGVSASLARGWLARHCAALRFDVFPPGSFPGALQEVFVLSGSITASGRGADRVRIVEKRADGAITDHWHVLDASGPWTKYLLPPAQVAAFNAAASGRGVVPVGELVAFEVSIVTGANDFFTVSCEDLANHQLESWGRPLLPRIRYAPGLTYTKADHERTMADGAASWILDFSDERPSPSGAAALYLAQGELMKLHQRYKCKIRKPWYRVPGFRRGEMLLSKRSHHYPRVVLNDAGVYTTDTIYRGRLLQASVSAETIASNFHNSFTLLTAELEGRSFGGGVLELVPSETARLLVPVERAHDELLGQLDLAARSGDPALLVAQTDASIVSRGLVDRDVMSELANARESLARRRFDRNGQPVTVSPSGEPLFSGSAQHSVA